MSQIEITISEKSDIEIKMTNFNCYIKFNFGTIMIEKKIAAYLRDCLDSVISTEGNSRDEMESEIEALKEKIEDLENEIEMIENSSEVDDD